MRDKVRKRVRARKIRQRGFGKHISDQQLMEFHSDLINQIRESKSEKSKRMD